MRLSISKKISFSLMLVLVLGIAAMAWLTAQSLQTGFNTYLKEKQLADMRKVAGGLAQYYEEHHSFEGLRHRPRVVRQIIDRALGRITQENPEEGGADGDAPPRRRPPPSSEMGPRISLIDEAGEPVFGPLRQVQHNLAMTVESAGARIGQVLAPMPEFAFEKNTADFIRTQLQHIVILALALIALAMVVAYWLGKHLVRPIAGLRQVTQQIASGQLQARATIVNQDELGDLAQHVNVMAQHLENQERKRKKMIADLSHELRTPLTVMRAEVEAMIDGVRPMNMDAAHSLEAEIAHLNKLVDDLHQLALADAGDLHFHFESVDVADLLRQIAERFSARFHKAQLHLQLDVPASKITLSADSGRLTQVLENCLENSLRYTDAPGTVVLRLRTQAGLVLIELEDSAPGLEAGTHAQLFERLYRKDSARSRAKGGSGLGLAICRSLVQAHRGEIQASASALGGVKILIALPGDR